jgi:roadblock/LC7 domain-containing protein
MGTLEESLAVDGVVAAGEFGPDGSLVDFESHMDMSSGFATMAAQFCATVTMLFNTLAPAFQVVSGMEWIHHSKAGPTAAGATRSSSAATAASSSKPVTPTSTGSSRR